MPRWILACHALLTLTAGATAADWPMYRCDAARSGYTAESLPDGLKPAWTYRAIHRPMRAWPTRSRLRYDAVFQPIAAAGRLYFGSSADGKVYALDAADGHLCWEFFTDAPVRLAPVYFDGRLFVASDDGYLYCLDAADGSLLWKLRGGPRDEMLLGNDRMMSRWPARGGPVVADGLVYFAAGIWPSEGIFLHAVDPANGEVRWRNESSGSIEMAQPHPTAWAKSGVAVQGHLAVQGDALIVPTGRAVPAVFDRRDGSFRYFHLQVNRGEGGAEVAAVDGHFYNGMTVFDLASGRAESEFGLTVAAHPDLVLASKVDGLVAYDRRNLFVEKKATGRKGEQTKTVRLAPPLWECVLPEGFGLQMAAPKGSETPAGSGMVSTVFSAPDITGQPGALIVAGNRATLGGRGQVLTVDLASRAVVWRAEVDGDCCGLAVADGRLYASTDRGVLHCFGADGDGPLDVSPSVAAASAEPDIFAEAATEILAKSGKTKGFCLDLGSGDGRLALELARRSDLVIYGVEKDPAKVRQARKMLDRAGLYGTRVTIHQGDPAKCIYPNYFADLVVSAASTEGDSAPPRYERMQRPYGGAVCFGRPGAMKVSVCGALAGAGSWTHQNTDSGNSFCSTDTLVRAPLEMLWFRDTDFVMTNRHGRGPAPLVADGRMFAQGLHGLRAVDVYNGRTLWEYPLENVLLAAHREHMIGAAWAGSNFCLGDGCVFVHTGQRCLKLDSATGRLLAEYPTPPLPDGKPGTWAYLAYEDSTLYGSLADEDYLIHSWRPEWDTSNQFIESKMLFALDVETGGMRWTYMPKHSIRNNAIAVADGRVYLIDRPRAEADDLRFPLGRFEAEAKRRAAAAGTSKDAELRRLTDQPFGRLFALDGRSGKTVWSVDEEVFGTQLAVSRPHGILLMSYQPAHVFSYVSERGDRMAALRLADGRRIWDVEAEYVARPILNDRTVYAEPGAWDLLTGEKLPFRMTRSYGCGIPSGSKNLLLFRSATLGYIDLTQGSQTENYGGIRPGCWVNAIPAGGLVLMADAASWCTCSYLNQATIALKPAAEQMAEGQ